MSDYYSTISVKGASVDQLKKLIQQELGDYFIDNLSRAPMDLIIEVTEYGSEYQYTNEFMKEQGLEESDSILKNLDLKGFDVNVELNCLRDSFVSDFIDPLSDSLAKLISEKLDVQTAIFFPDMEAPYCIYSSGKVHKKFAQAYKSYFEKRGWLPRVE